MKYCGSCGKETVAMPTKRFDVYTGERQTYQQCMNPQCADCAEGKPQGFWEALLCGPSSGGYP